MFIVEISTPQIAYLIDTKIPIGNSERIAGIFSAYDAKKTARLLNRERYGSEVPPYKKSARNRIIHRDIAARYLRIFKGHTEWIQTDADAGYPVLIDADGETRGEVLMFDKFPVSVDTKALAEIPF